MIVVIDSVCLPGSEINQSSQEEVLLNFLTALGYDPLDPPLGDLLRRYHHLEGDWLIVSPVYWEASHNDAQILATGKALQWTEIQARDSYQLFEQFVAADGMTLHYHSSDCWLLRIDNKPSIKSKPVKVVMKRSMMNELQGLDVSMYWQKFITESQMFFSSQSMSPLVNGIWPWGASKLQSKALVVCVDEALYSVACNSQTEVSLYKSSVLLKNYQLLLLESLNNLSPNHQQQLKKMPITWYWNDKTYTDRPNYLIRLWRHLIHAH
ncbi:MAG: hypothetical protein H0U75_02570 [Legionella sp.]|nr:hypothetical protein [Legionella sp.]